MILKSSYVCVLIERRAWASWSLWHAWFTRCSCECAGLAVLYSSVPCNVKLSTSRLYITHPSAFDNVAEGVEDVRIIDVADHC